MYRKEEVMDVAESACIVTGCADSGEHQSAPGEQGLHSGSPSALDPLRSGAVLPSAHVVNKVFQSLQLLYFDVLRTTDHPAGIETATRPCACVLACVRVEQLPAAVRPGGVLPALGLPPG